MIRFIKIAIGCCLLLGLVSDGLAEVAARVNRRGEYSRTTLIPAGTPSEPQIWSVRGMIERRRVALNREGDTRGDQWPSIVETHAAPHHAWVSWARRNGARHDLVWSRWLGRGWAPIEWVHSEEVAAGGNDLDPQMAFSSTDLPYLVWWREREGSNSMVLISRFDGTEWSRPFPVHLPRLNGRFPEIIDAERDAIGERVLVRFETDEGAMVQAVRFTTTDTITDDINPQDSISISRDGRPKEVNED